MRLEVFSRKGFTDGRARRLLASLVKSVAPRALSLRIVDVFILEGVEASVETLREVFSDAVSQDILMDRPAAEACAWDYLIEVTSRPGVTDPVAITARDALKRVLSGGLPQGALVQTGAQYLLGLGAGKAGGGGEAGDSRGGSSKAGAAGGPDLDPSKLALFFHNPLIQSAVVIPRSEWDRGRRLPGKYPHVVSESPARMERFCLESMDEKALLALSRSRLLALNAAEMRAVQGYFSRPDVKGDRLRRGLGHEATDVELEMIAQTWSEHCKHKIFGATVRYREEGAEPQTITSLFDTYIRRTTEETSRAHPELRSVFHDNSGVVAFDEDTLLCFKVETHNSPSALDPYGGAITGIVGVNRDIMGTGLGAKPIFNTNVLCFGPPDTADRDVPEGLLHPSRVLEGVHRGIVDGGNQSGIPTVAGGFLFDESFLGKPLVFCGTGGILPASIRGRPSWEKRVEPGDLAVMMGGRIGKDGIHGATFSSEALSESSPTSAVQIGDPITQKKMLDLLLEARDLGLYRGLTDNGAGGLSSSLGEMAQLSGGVVIELDACPLKYAGLAPWEILVSESQERMSLAVPPASIDALLALARRRDVEAAVVGRFTDTGMIEVLHKGEPAAAVSLEFLHKGLPVMELDAEWKRPRAHRGKLPAAPALADVMMKVLSDPNVASKEEWVRQYDHEVQGRSVIKPFVGRDRDAPSDGGVLKVRPDSWRGISVTHGICPWYGDWDAYDMAQCAVDEAVRAHVAMGGDPEVMSALDNFCWPDPVQGADNPDGAFKMAQLVRACRGLADACRAYSLPLISGKDSMKNDARIGGRKLSVRPTLLVSLMGMVPDIRLTVTSDFKSPGDAVYVVGETRGEMGCTRYERAAGEIRLGRSPSLDSSAALRSYRALHRAMLRGLVRSCHDLSDGGLWVALAESALGGGVGAEVDLAAVPASKDCGAEPARILFSETPSRFLVGVAREMEEEWLRIMDGVPCARVGAVTAGDVVTVRSGKKVVARVGLADIRGAWKGQGGGAA